MDSNDRMAQSLAAASGDRRPMIGNLASSLQGVAVDPKQARSLSPVPDELGYDVAIRLAFLGVGQGGGRIASSFWHLGYRRVLALNGTERDFDHIPDDMPKHAFGTSGAAKDMEAARLQFRARVDTVWDLLVRHWGSEVDQAFVCAGLGGGTGGGMLVPAIDQARKYLEELKTPVRVGALVSLPAELDGQIVCRNAVKAFHALWQSGASPIVVIDNDRIQHSKRPPFSKLFPIANDSTAGLLSLFNQLAAVRGVHGTFDTSELCQMFSSRLVTMLSADLGTSDKLKSPADVSDAVRHALENSLLVEADAATAKMQACLCVADQATMDVLSLDYFRAAPAALERLVQERAAKESQFTSFLGEYLGDAPGLQVYCMLGGLDVPQARLTRLASRGSMTGGKADGLAEFLRM